MVFFYYIQRIYCLSVILVHFNVLVCYIQLKYFVIISGHFCVSVTFDNTTVCLLYLTDINIVFSIKFSGHFCLSVKFGQYMSEFFFFVSLVQHHFLSVKFCGQLNLFYFILVQHNFLSVTLSINIFLSVTFGRHNVLVCYKYFVLYYI